MFSASTVNLACFS